MSIQTEPRIISAILSAGLLVCLAESNSGFSNVPSAAQTSPARTTEWIQRLRLFHTYYNNLDDADPRKLSGCRSLLAALSLDEVKVGPTAKALQFYASYCRAALGDGASEKESLIMIANSVDDANVLEAKFLLAQINHANRSAAGESEAAILFDEEEMKLYPRGATADVLMTRSVSQSVKPDESSPTPIRTSHGAIELRASMRKFPNEATEAGNLYRTMGCIPEAMECYRDAIGLMARTEWFSPKAAPVWMAIGDCLSTEGKWEVALTYYLKSLASGQPLADVTRRIRDMDAAITEKRGTPAAGQKKLDRASLERIANLLADTELFDPAIRAAEAARGIGGETLADELTRSLHKRKAELLQRVINVMGEGLNVRGAKATKEAVTQEQLLAVK